ERASAAISSWSVETTTLATDGAADAAWTARPTSVMPSTRARFFSGTPCEPPRAGMITMADGPAVSGMLSFDGLTRAGPWQPRARAACVARRALSTVALHDTSPGRRGALGRPLARCGRGRHL